LFFKIILDSTIAYLLGYFGGGTFYFIKYMINYSPSLVLRSFPAFWNRASGSPSQNFLKWGFLFGSYHCVIPWIRGHHDAFNTIAAGALTGATLQYRRGARSMARSAMFSGFFFAVIEVLPLVFGHRIIPSEFNPNHVPPRPRHSGYIAPGYLGNFRTKVLRYFNIPEKKKLSDQLLEIDEKKKRQKERELAQKEKTQKEKESQKENKDQKEKESTK